MHYVNLVCYDTSHGMHMRCHLLSCCSSFSCLCYLVLVSAAGTFESSTCQSTCESLPPWALVAICLGSAIVLGVITCMTFVFVCRCMKYKVALAKARAQAQQQLPTTAVPGPTPEEAPLQGAAMAPPPVQATCIGIPATGVHGTPYAPMPAKPYPTSNTVSYPDVKGSGKDNDKPTKPPPV